jgi:23S rRNA (cytosine1962-C5)-methyltransferase
VHAEADGLPGVVIDRFGDAAVIQPNAAWAEAHLDATGGRAGGGDRRGDGGQERHGPARGLEGLAEETAGAARGGCGPVPVPMNGAIYMADLLGGQKTGLFYDQRPNHAFAARLARGARVLDVFSHVGGFGWPRWRRGPHALAVDGSAPALALAAQGARRWAWPTALPRGRAMPLPCWRRWAPKARGSIWWSATRPPLRRQAGAGGRLARL